MNGARILRLGYGFHRQQPMNSLLFFNRRCRTYLQNLAATVEIKDADNLIDQRTKIELQIVDVSASIATGKDVGTAEAATRKQFHAERGGDADVVFVDRPVASLEASGAFFERQ